jgi:hypothetical protein
MPSHPFLGQEKGGSGYDGASHWSELSHSHLNSIKDWQIEILTLTASIVDKDVDEGSQI